MDSIEYEALKRAQELQRGQSPNQGNNQNRRQNNSQNRNQSHNPAQRESNHTPAPAPKEADIPQAQSSTPVQTVTQKTQSGDLLNTLFEDKEKLLILVLILILTSEESSDPSLILALLYLII